MEAILIFLVLPLIFLVLIIIIEWKRQELEDPWLGCRFQLQEDLTAKQPGTIRLEGTNWQVRFIEKSHLKIRKGQWVVIEKLNYRRGLLFVSIFDPEKQKAKEKEKEKQKKQEDAVLLLPNGTPFGAPNLVDDEDEYEDDEYEDEEWENEGDEADDDSWINERAEV